MIEYQIKHIFPLLLLAIQHEKYHFLTDFPKTLQSFIVISFQSVENIYKKRVARSVFFSYKNLLRISENYHVRSCFSFLQRVSGVTTVILRRCLGFFAWAARKISILLRNLLVQRLRSSSIIRSNMYFNLLLLQKGLIIC